MSFNGVVVCEKPRGCGWWWERHTTKRWLVTRTYYYGPFWPKNDISDGAPRWTTAEQFAEEYADCQPLLKINYNYLAPDREPECR